MNTNNVILQSTASFLFACWLSASELGKTTPGLYQLLYNMTNSQNCQLERETGWKSASWDIVSYNVEQGTPKT